MGYLYAYGHCFICRNSFSFNPELVPSVTVESARRPVCRDCMERANVLRLEDGNAPVLIDPRAYEPEEVA